MTIVSRLQAQWSRLDGLFRDHEVFVRTGGAVRFLRISASAQRRAAAIAAVVLLVWLVATAAMLAWQAHSAWRTSDVAARQIAVQRAEARVAATQGAVATTARDLDRRLDYLESVTGRLTPDGAQDAATPAAATPATTTAADDSSDKISELRAMIARQDRLVVAMTAAADRRAVRAETALRTVGISSRALTRGAQGGPFLPYRDRSGVAPPRDPAINSLSAAIARMETLEQLVVALPSIRPAEVIRLSSGFGYRRDPFTGGGAMHSGLDFTGAHGSPIHAAAPGRVSFVGRQSGYGNVVEIDHGHGIMTRYAHLARFDVRAGQMVTAGQTVAGMGSTGRSTGTHLHFEVRVGGAAVNPRRFLEATADVLEIQADAGQRARSRTAR